MVRRVLLALFAVGAFAVIPMVASAATPGPLDGETLAGAIPPQGVSCYSPDGVTTFLGTRGSRGGLSGVATGPVTGTYSGAHFLATLDTTGSVTDFGASFNINDALGNTVYSVDVTLGAGHAVASCTDSAYTLTVTDATYTAYDSTGAVSGTGVVSLSVTYDIVTGIGTLTANFGPQLPTTEDQCKNGGYMTYPAFKNQGDCVSYVASKGKNPPGK